MNSWLEKWQDRAQTWYSTELFFRALCLFWLWNTLRLLPIGASVWGPDTMIILNHWYQGFDELTMLLNRPELREVYLLFVLPFIGILAAAVLGLHSFASRIVTWILFAILHQANPEVSNGGYHLGQQLFFISVFFVGTRKQSNSKWSSAKNWIHQLAFSAIWIQLAIMYSMAGLQKLRGDLWISGDAMAIILSMEEYSLPWISELVKSNNGLLRGMTYMGLAYQLIFPLLIWIKTMRPLLLIAGTAFHLFIAFVIGITDYGIELLAVYLIFIPQQNARNLLARLPWKNRALSKALESEA